MVVFHVEGPAWIVFSKAVTEELPERDQYTALKVAAMVSTQHTCC
jgi:hypothetical protein